MFEFDIFRGEVLTDYQRKKGQGLLHTQLENPSPANLRDYASNRFYQGLKAEDLVIFEEFFNPQNKYEELGKAIKQMDLGRLKSVQNFLNGSVNSPDELIVKLCAILIDFQPRPYIEWKKSKNNYINRDSIDDLPEPVNIKKSEPAKKISLVRNLNFSVAGVALIALGYIGYSNLKPDGCMFWNGEKYEIIDCDQHKENAEIVVLNEQEVLNFKKITRPDTLAEKHVDKVWYSKINNEVEFFTSSGRHPIFKEKRLKPATWYMIQKYQNSNVKED